MSGKGEDIDDNWQNWLGRGPLGQLGDNLGLFRVIWAQLGVIVAKQGSLCVSWGSLWVIGVHWDSVVVTEARWGSLGLSVGHWD